MFAQISVGNSSETFSKELIISNPKGINCAFEKGFKKKPLDSESINPASRKSVLSELKE
jgi:hypothetical protein